MLSFSIRYVDRLCTSLAINFYYKYSYTAKNSQGLSRGDNPRLFDTEFSPGGKTVVNSAPGVFPRTLIDYPASGFASLTHYSLPLDAIASCGCVPASTHYPTAALSQLAYGSSRAFGPACGRCFNLTLLNTFLSSPPFYPNVTKSVVVKVTDLCPFISEWCTATKEKANP